MGLRSFGTLSLCLLFLVMRTFTAGDPHVGQIYPGFQASQLEWSSNNGLFLLSKNSTFALGFYTTLDVKLFVLVVIHLSSSKVVWTANRGLLISNSDKFVFEKNGNVHLSRGNGKVWSINTTGEKVASIELLDSGNLVLLGDEKKVIWQSFNHPTDTLLPGQEFLEGMKLKSFPNKNRLSHYLEIKSGNLVLYAGYHTPQLYWSIADDNRKTNRSVLEKVGSLQRSGQGPNGYVSYMKVLKNSGGGLSPINEESTKRNKNTIIVVVILISTILVIIGLLYVGFWYHRKKTRLVEFSKDTMEDVYFLDSLSRMPVRFTYNDLRRATHNFLTKVGQGGFGSVYLGVLPDGTGLAVKKLEGIGQGKKEFRAEVSTIGNIHHVHLVRLKGFCAEGPHRLLVYEYMSKGSLDKWIFESNEEGSHLLDWNTRFNIALGTAKGLAYLHEECEGKIIHCDIKPENVLLDDNFVAKVSDFGLAKLTNREQSNIYTTLRGTRGYLAPEWITNCAISEKSDVYSYGIVLLEIIGGRKNYDPKFSSEKTHFPSYTFRMLEEGKLKEILDSKLEIDEEDERVSNAIKVALWCVQDEMHLRPPMTKVVQMLEGLCAVPPPPTISHTSFLKWSSRNEEASSSGLINSCTDISISDVRLSGPR